MRNLFNIYFLNVLLLCVFGVGFGRFSLLLNSNKDVLLSFIKSDGSPLVKLLKLAVITFFIWMIWRMRNYARFQDKIDVFKAISIIKDLTCLVGNSSKASMKNDMLDLNVIKFVGINTRTGKVLCPLPVIWEFPSPGWVKINTNRAARGYVVLLLVEVFSVRVWGSLLVVSLCFLMFRLLRLLSFM